MSRPICAVTVPNSCSSEPPAGVSWHEVFGPASAEWPSPHFIGGDPCAFPLASTIPAAGVYEAVNATVLTPEGWVLTEKGTVLAACSWYGLAGLHDWMPRDVVAPVEALDGLTLVLASDWAANNYGHFLLDVAPRIHLVERAGYQLSSFDHVLVPHRMLGQAALLQQAGVTNRQRRWSEQRTAFRCARLVAPSFPGVRRSLTPWAANFLRDRFAPKASGPTRRLFVLRDTTRCLHNETVVVRALSEFGFEPFLPGADDRDPREVFASADYIVGPHGAGLADLVFAPRGGQILELLPTDHIFPYYFCAAVSAGLRYTGVLCKSDVERGMGARGPSRHDMTAPLETIAEYVRSTVGR